MRPIQILRDPVTADPALDTAVSRALLHGVAGGTTPESFRILIPGRNVAFGRRDRPREGYPAAVRAVSDLGFVPVERLAGGKAAVFHEQTLSFSWTIPDPAPQTSIHPRFQEIAGIIAAALTSLGVDAQVGEVPGEYCPGDYSVNASGRRKIMGVGQRLVKGAAHLGGVIVVANPDLVNRPLIPAYRHLGYDWDPETTGAVSDQANATPGDVADAVLAELGDRFELRSGSIGDELVAKAVGLAAEHRPSIA